MSNNTVSLYVNDRRRVVKPSFLEAHTQDFFSILFSLDALATHAANPLTIAVLLHGYTV